MAQENIIDRKNKTERSIRTPDQNDKVRVVPYLNVWTTAVENIFR